MDAVSVFVGVFLGIGLYWALDSFFAWRAEGTPAATVESQEERELYIPIVSPEVAERIAALDEEVNRDQEIAISARSYLLAELMISRSPDVREVFESMDNINFLKALYSAAGPLQRREIIAGAGISQRDYYDSLRELKGIGVIEQVGEHQKTAYQISGFFRRSVVGAFTRAEADVEVSA